MSSISDRMIVTLYTGSTPVENCWLKQSIPYKQIVEFYKN